MKNANQRPWWSQNEDNKMPTLTECFVHFIVAALAFYMIFLMFGCSNKLQPGKNYTLPNGQVLEAYKHAIFIKDQPKKS